MTQNDDERTSHINEKLRWGIQTLLRNGKPPQDILEFLRRENPQLEKISLEEIEALQVGRIIDYCGGRSVERLPLTPAFKQKIQALFSLEGMTTERVLQYLHEALGHTDLQASDIEHLSPTYGIDLALNKERGEQE